MNTDRQSSSATNLQTQLSDNREDSQARQGQPTKRRLRSPSIGTRLFLLVMGGALIGIGGMAFFFYRTLEQEAKTQIGENLNTEVIAIESKLEPLKQSGRNLAGAIQMLSSKKAIDPDIYNALVLDFFLKRPDLSMGVALSQSPYGILQDRKWYSTYFYLDQKAQGQIGKRLAPPNEQVFQVDLLKEDNYPNQGYYKDVVALGKENWSEPYNWYGITMTTFSGLAYDRRHKVLAVAGIDVNLTALSAQIGKSVLRNQGYFVLISEQGKLLSYPPAPTKATRRDGYESVPELKAVLSQLSAKQKKERSGVLRTGGKYWAYQRVANTNWLMLATVPESVAIGPVLAITLTGAVGAGLLIAVVVLLFVQRLNRRLQPILDECHKLVQANAAPEAQLQKQDEIGRLSASFFNLLAQLAANEEAIRQEVARSVQTETQLQQAAEEQRESEALQTEVNHILDIVSAVEMGDLTVQAEVSDRATGLVADTLNRLIEELARIMAAVLSTTQQVTQGSTELEQLAAVTAQQAQQQAQSVNAVQASVINFNDLSQQTAQQALVSKQAVQQAQIAVTQGQQEMEKLTEEIKVLHSGTEQIVKRAQMLTNFVTSAAQFAKDQKRVAALTRVLALNASMIAARASGQQDPDQFASVAREFETIATQVNDLAVQTNQGLLLLQQQTTQIQTVVSGINQDVQDISHSVNQFVGGVEQSQYVFELIKNVTDRVAQVGQQVTASSQAIATEAQLTLRSIEEIATVAAKTEQQSSFTQEQAGLIDNMARALLDKVRFFRIPEEDEGDKGNSDQLPVTSYQ